MLQALLGPILGILALLPAVAHSAPAPHAAEDIETVTVTYYLPTGNVTRGGHWPVEGWTVGCDVSKLGAYVTFLSTGDTYLCDDTGLTYSPWADFYADSNGDGLALVQNHADYVGYDGMYRATVLYTWP